MRRLVSCLVLLGLCAAPARAQEPEPLHALYRRAFGAYYVTKDYAAFKRLSEEIAGRLPGSALAQFDLAAAHALTGDKAAAVELLGRVADRRLGFDPRADERFASLDGDPGYAAVLARVDAGEPVVPAPVAVRAGEPDCIPEGIAVDPRTGTVYLGSMARRKILAIDRRGRARDFVPEGRYGLTDVLGIKVDAARGLLWACAIGRDTERQPRASTLWAFELATGRYAGSWVPPDASIAHGMNDIAIMPDGTLYVTDSDAGCVYRLAPGGARLEPALPPGALIYPNGIAAAPGGRLFVASEGRGVSVLDPSTGELRDVDPGPDATLAGIDGLASRGRELFAVQNGIGRGRVMRYRLDEGLGRVVWSKVLASRHPDFEIPTTGSLAGGAFWVLANSQLRRLRPDGTVDASRPLRAPAVLRISVGSGQ